jgi:hypothetical protein
VDLIGTWTYNTFGRGSMSQPLKRTSSDEPAGDELAVDEVEDELAVDEPGMSPLQMSIAGIVGVASAGAGAVAVFQTENELGSAALITVGVYFLIALIIRRFPKFKLGDNEIDPTARRLARQADRRARRAAEDAVDAKEGLKATTAGSESLRSEQSAAPPPSIDPEIVQLADEYNHVRWTMPSGNVRTLRMTDIVERMVARFREVDSPDVEGLLTSSDRGLRLAGVAAVYARPTPNSIPRLVELSITPDKPFNEYWALRALARSVDGNCEALTADHRKRLEARLGALPHGADRGDEIRRILRSCP